MIALISRHQRCVQEGKVREDPIVHSLMQIDPSSQGSSIYYQGREVRGFLEGYENILEKFGGVRKYFSKFGGARKHFFNFGGVQKHFPKYCGKYKNKSCIPKTFIEFINFHGFSISDVRFLKNFRLRRATSTSRTLSQQFFHAAGLFYLRCTPFRMKIYACGRKFPYYTRRFLNLCMYPDKRYCLQKVLQRLHTLLMCVNSRFGCTSMYQRNI